MPTPLLRPATARPAFRRSLGLLGGAALLSLAAHTADAQVVFGLSGSDLTSVNLASPFTSQTRTAITGVAAGQTLVGLDFRPATGELYALGYNSALTTANAQLYVINQTTAVATPVGAVMALALGGSTERIGFDFNPTVDRIRVVSTNDANYRLHPTTGAVTLDGAIAFAAGDANAGQNPYVGAAAYTNSFIGAASTTLYTVDEQRSLLLIQNPPNNGTQNTVVPLNPQAGGNATPINAPGASTDLDIINFGVNNGAIDQQAYLNVNQVQGGQFVSLLYRLNLTTGATTLAGAINGNGVGITDIAIRIDRTAPAVSGQLLYALNTNNTLLSFYSGTPQYINSAVPLTGVTAGQTIVGTDFRPNTGQLFGFGYDATTAGANSQLYTINVTSGVATAVGAAIRLELGGTTANIGFDFNPTVDRIRVTSSNRANLRLNPNNGALAATDGNLAYAAGDTTTARIGSVGYTNSYPGSTSTTLYDLDDARNVLATQNPPNAGTLNVVGGTGLGVSPTTALVDLDIYFDRSSNVNQAFLTANPNGSNFNNLYTLNLASGSPTLVGAIGLGITVRDISASLEGANASAALTGRLLYGVAGGNLVSFDSGNPTVIRTAVNITGLPADGSQVLVGTDFSPATGELFALGYNAATQQGQLYTLNTTTGALSAVGSLNSMALGATAANIGFDFNPTVNLIRVTSGTNQANLRVNPTTGAVTVDTNLSNSSGTPVLTGVAYTNNDNNANTGTTLYGIDQARSVLLRSTNANGGTYVDQGALNVTLNAALGADFDIYSDLSTPATPGNAAFLAAAPTGSSNDNLYTVDLASGAASSVGRIGSGSNLTGLAAFLTPGPVIAAGLTWTGAVSTDWGTAGNWSPAQVPTATDNVTIPDVANDPVVSNAQQANGVTLASGATLTTVNGGTLTVNGTFTNNGGTTLGSGTGTIAFNGAAAQTISGTTTFFNNLTAGPAGVTASAPVQVQRVLLLNGNLTSGGNLTLLSNATGTAHVVNNGGVVSGNATVQRYIDASLNPGAGYRHFSAPVSNTTLADLATGSYSPVVNPAYNTAPVPNNVTPFPTVFGYDETRVTSSGNPAPQDFDRGFFSPNATTDPMTVGRGYTVNIPAGQTPDFVGTLNNGAINIGGLTRGTQTESGWQLLGNPYPSPLNWDLVSRSNVDAAVYVYRSTGQYAGTYSTYVANGVGINGGTNVIGTGQGFFVRVSTPGSANGQVAFANAARFTTYQSPVFQRTAAVSGPLVRLALQAASGPADETVVYLEPGATVGFDAALDAYKLLAGGAPLLASPIDAATRLSVNALPPLSATAPERVIPLHVQGLQAGAHTLRATELLNLPAGTYAYLRDADTGALVDLQAQPNYSFTLANTSLTTRFSLVLTQNRVTATASAALAQQIGLYPNPARNQVTLQLPAALAQQPVAVSVLNALGQQVLTRALPAGRSADALTLPLTGLAKGVYTVRLTTPAGLVAKRLVVE